MMRLSTMAKVDAAIRADGGSPVAERVLERWTYDRGSVQFFRSSANFIYRFRDQERSRYLRFADASERSREAVESEMVVVEAVAASGLVAATPVPSRNGNVVETVDTEWGTFHAVVFPALGGEQYELSDLDGSRFRRWGGALGRLHAATSRLANLPERPTWRDHLGFIQKYLPADSPALRAEFDEIAASFAALPMARDGYGLAHCDFELDNLVWSESDIGMLDFDDCSYLWYVGDVAWALRDLFETGVDTSDLRLLAFVDGYREHHPLDDASVARLPLFLRYARLLTDARLIRSMDLPTGEEQMEHPEWLRRLSSKLLDRMAEYRAAIESQRH